MACYHPIVAYDLASSIGTGSSMKANLVFDIIPSRYPSARMVQLPCGKCVGCRLDYSREWANRCMLELGYHRSSYFATFTYDDAHLPYSYSVDQSTGEVVAPVATLRRRDSQLLLKRIRKNFPDCKIRYFGSGEYGTQTLRPHYHIILFGLELNDLETYKKGNKVGMYYTSPSLQSCWPFGYVIVTQVTWDTCAYVARYCLKKHAVSDKSAYEIAGIEPEFSMCSRKPGIGYQYYVDHPDLWRFDAINVPGDTCGKKVYPPKYFKRMLKEDNPELARQLSDRNMLRFQYKESLKKGLTDLDYYDRIQVEERSKQKRILALTRNII